MLMEHAAAGFTALHAWYVCVDKMAATSIHARASLFVPDWNVALGGSLRGENFSSGLALVGQSHCKIV